MERWKPGEMRSEFSARHFSGEVSAGADEVKQVCSPIAATVGEEMLRVLEDRVFGAEDASPPGEYQANVYGLVGED